MDGVPPKVSYMRVELWKVWGRLRPPRPPPDKELKEKTHIRITPSLYIEMPYKDKEVQREYARQYSRKYREDLKEEIKIKKK